MNDEYISIPFNDKTHEFALPTVSQYRDFLLILLTRLLISRPSIYSQIHLIITKVT